MDSIQWHGVVYSLSPSKLLSLHEHVVKALELHGYSKISTMSSPSRAIHSHFQGPTSLSKLAHSVHSGQSTPQISSACSDDSQQFPYKDSSVLWPTNQDMDPDQPRNMSPMHHTNFLDIHNEGEGDFRLLAPTTKTKDATKRLYFCTIHKELGEDKTCVTKQDWKRHMIDFHEEVGLEWHCRFKGCQEVFGRKKELKKHYKSHDRKAKAADLQVQVLQHQRVYACGFEHCRFITSKWETWCDHVADCIQAGESQWSYTRRMRNLLRHETVSKTWKKVHSRWCDDVSELKWDPIATANMRYHLEHLLFGDDLEGFLVRLLWVGHPNHNVAGTFMPQPKHAGMPLLSSPAPFLPNVDVATDPITLDDFSFCDSISPGNQLQHTAEEGSAIVNHDLVSSKANRSSVIMTDAPPSAQDVFTLESWQDFLQTTTDASAVTPPLAQPIFAANISQASDPPAVLPRRSMRQKSMNWLRPKRSQNLNQGCTTNGSATTTAAQVSAFSPGAMESAVMGGHF